MFVRFRQDTRRLRLSLVETRRDGGKVRHEHVASLGAAELPLSTTTRLRFWEQLHPRLARLANRLSQDQAKALAAAHARVPMVTADERRALQREVAADEIKFWETLQGMNEDLSSGNRELAAIAERTSTEAAAAAKVAGEHVAAARERIGRLDRGEDFAGGTTKVDMRRLAHEAGLTDVDIRHTGNVARIHDLGAEREYLDAISPNKQRERRIARRIIAKHRGV